MTAPGWSFLVARARTATHRVVVAPDFLSARAAEAVLHRVARGADTPAGAAVVHRFGAEGLVVVARVFVADRADYGIPGDGPVRDGSGRVVRFTEGIVLRGSHVPAITDADLARARDQVRPAYQRFWTEQDAFVTAPSTGFPLAAPGTPIRLMPATPTAGAPERPDRRGWVRVAAFAGAAVAVAGAIFVRFAADSGAPTASPTTSTAAPAPCAAAACLVSPADLGGATPVLVPANAATAGLTTGAPCGTTNHPALSLSWAGGTAGEWSLDWSSAPAQQVDLSDYQTVALTLDAKAVGALDLVAVDNAANEAAVPVPLDPARPGPRRVTIAMAGLGGIDLSGVRAIGLRWPAGAPGRAQLCVSGIAFH